MADVHPQVAQLYRRIYARSDIRSARGVVRLGLVIAGVWLLCGVVNYLFLASSVRDEQERAILSFAFGPAFVPLDVARAGDWVTVAGLDVPLNMAALVIGGLPTLLCGGLLFGNGGERTQWHQQRRRARQHAAQQNRFDPERVVQAVGLPELGLPLALVNGTPIGLPFGEDRGHVAVIAPSRSGKGLHLTEALLAWPGAAVVVDPKGEQWNRTAGYRAAHVGPVYRIPRVGLDVLQFFNANDPLDVQELHTNLLRTWQDREPIFAEKSLALFFAAVTCGAATKEHPLRVLARWSEMSALDALREAAVHAPQRVAQFTDGDSVGAGATLNRFAQSAWGTFTTRFAPLVPHINTVTTSDVPQSWIAERATIYITYPLDQLETAGALVSAMFAACIKAQMRQRTQAATLFALDEVPTTALARLDTYISTIGGYGGVLLLYLQTSSQLDDVYGVHKARTILGNCNSKVFYPPRDLATMEHVSRVFGTELRYTRTQSTSRSVTREGASRQQTSTSYVERTEPVFSPTELDALPAEAVIVQVQGPNQQYRVLGERLNPIPTFATLPPPPPVVRPPRIRTTLSARQALAAAPRSPMVPASGAGASEPTQRPLSSQNGQDAPSPPPATGERERYW